MRQVRWLPCIFLLVGCLAAPPSRPANDDDATADDDDTTDDDDITDDDDAADDDDDSGDDDDDDTADDDDVADDDDTADDDDVADDDDTADDDDVADDDDTADDDDVADDDDTGTPGGCLTVMTVQGMDFVHVCGGTFDMGCTGGQSNCEADESPDHTVTLTNDFYLGRYEVTQDEWGTLLPSSPNPSHFSPIGSGPDCGPNCPVENINWWESLALANALSTAEGLSECYALTGCDAVAPGNDMECSGVTVNASGGNVYDCDGYRLPTEAEWEYAARGGEDLLYSGSVTLSAVGWYPANSVSTTQPVGLLQANAFGLSDMSGNVWEWTWDWYDSNYYSNSPGGDPTGPTSPGSQRVIRGGSWSDLASKARVARRDFFPPGALTSAQGLRLARTVP